MEVFNTTGSYNHFMMPIDTHSYYKMLEEAGAPHKLAEVLIKMWVNHMEHNLATKVDIEKLRMDIEKLRISHKDDITEVKTEIAEVRNEIAAVKTEIAAVKTELSAEIKTSFSECKIDILKWIIPLMVVLFIAIIGKGWR